MTSVESDSGLFVTGLVLTVCALRVEELIQTFFSIISSDGGKTLFNQVFYKYFSSCSVHIPFAFV